MLLASGAALIGCMPGTSGPGPSGNQNGPANDNTNTNGSGEARPIWGPAFDPTNVGFLSAVWGSGPDDVFVVGGQPDQAEVYHFDGTQWRGMSVPRVPVLVWVFGFGPDDVYAVGIGGGAIHYDGAAWTALDSGTSEDLWGIWGTSPSDMWVVGGNVTPDGADVGSPGPLILHYDGRMFTAVPAPSLDRPSVALFKVWGIGSKLFAVGQYGLILQYEGGAWVQVPTIPPGNDQDDDFVSLWGTSEGRIVTVGGRSTGRVGVYDGAGWTVQRPSGVPGLNAIYTVDPSEAIVGGVNGYCGRFEPTPATLTAEDSTTGQTIHAIWGDGAGKFYAVGGRTAAVPFSGMTLVRVIGTPDPTQPPPPPPTEPPRLEIGVANGSPYTRIDEGGAMPVFLGTQGGINFSLTIRGTGFPPDAPVSITQSGVLIDDGRVIVSELTADAMFRDIGGGADEILDRFVLIETMPGEVNGRRARLTFRITDNSDPAITATIEQEVVLIELAP